MTRSPVQPVTAPRIQGAGDMAARIREFPWERHSLGPIESWPPELTTMVNMMLSSDELAGVYWGPELTFLYNDAFVPHLIANQLPLGKPYWEIWDETAHDARALIESPLRTGKAFRTPALPLKLKRDGGLEQTFYSVNGSPIFAWQDGQCQVGGAFLTYSDQTQTVLQAQQLAETEARASRILDSIGDAVIVTDAEGRIRTLNGVAEQVTGWNEADARGIAASEVYRLIQASTRKPVENPADSARQLGHAVNLSGDTILLAKDGTERYISDSGAPILDHGGRVSGTVVVFRDVTQAHGDQHDKTVAAAMQKLLLSLTDAQRRATDVKEIIQIATERLGVYLHADRVGYSEATADLKSMRFETGWAQGGLAPLTGSVPINHWGDITSADFLRGRTVIYSDVRSEPDLVATAKHYAAMDTVSLLAVPFLRRGVWRGSLYVNHSEPRQWTALEIGLVEEVARRTAEAAERAQAEEELRALADRLGMAQEAGQMASWQWEFVTDNLMWDGGSEWTYGRPPSEMTESAAIFSYLHEEDRARVRRDLVPAIEGTGVYRSEFRVVWPDGSIHWILAFGRTVWSSDGRATGIVGININVTEQKQAQAALMQTEKLAAVGRLASTMAHEINNPLEAVMNLLFLARQSGDIAEAQPYLETADAELRRAAMIVNQALRFHKQATRPTLSSFEQLTHDLFRGRHSRLTNAGASVQERDRTSQPVLCFEGEIRQVLNNLVTNAIDALSAEGGTLFLRGRDGRDWKTGRSGMVLTLADTGSGMSKATRRRVFDAFFTTKGVGGTGLGLWVTKEIIDRHAGRLSLRSSDRTGRRGTAVAIFLPYEAVVRGNFES